jgi:hypothetical protein
MRRFLRVLTIAILAGVIPPEAEGYERYYTDAGNCADCHGAFTDGTSPQGSEFPNDDKHRMHRAAGNMDTECNLCHTSSDGRNPWIGSSDGTASNTGVGCVGCHGREGDAGNDSVSPGRGAGLRQHHHRSGINACAGCHTDANPTNYTPVGEDWLPQYYGTADTNADKPCNPDATSDTNENWTAESPEQFVGLDNDGDLDYDGADADCDTGCTTNADCDDSNVCTDDVCDQQTGECSNTPNTASCDDGDACTTADTCSGGTCVGGAPPDCDDSNVCTDDSCDSVTGCVNTNNAIACDDGDACTTADTCSGGQLRCGYRLCERWYGDHGEL